MHKHGRIHRWMNDVGTKERGKSHINLTYSCRRFGKFENIPTGRLEMFLKNRKDLRKKIVLSFFCCSLAKRNLLYATALTQITQILFLFGYNLLLCYELRISLR